MLLGPTDGVGKWGLVGILGSSEEDNALLPTLVLPAGLPLPLHERADSAELGRFVAVELLHSYTNMGMPPASVRDARCGFYLQC